MGTKTQRWIRAGLVSAALVLGILAIYWQTRHFHFTNYDDEHYVTQNPQVIHGLTLRGIAWAFTTGYFSYWHPLTWLSHMVDVELFGFHAGRHHLSSMILHSLNSIALFLVMQAFTRRWAASAAVAALFALHPTHVESVAWIAERKDVLSGWFWILTLGAYGWYAVRRSVAGYLLALFFFGCGLMSKPMVVTLPLVLLLWDYWPLRRLPWSAQITHPDSGLVAVPTSWRTIWLEKIPFFLLMLLSCGVTFFGVRHGASIVSDQQFPLGLRLANIPISYLRYLGKTIAPENLAVLYPMPDHWALWQVTGSIVILVLMSVPIFLLARRCPYLVVGWLWFLGTLFPTIGIVPVGLQSMADRYTYLPSIGLFVMAAWGLADLVRARTWGRPALAGLSVLALVACVMMARAQTRHWYNNETLFAHAVNVTTNNAVAHYNLGLSLILRGEVQGATRHFEQAARLDPKSDRAFNNLGLALLTADRLPEATNAFARAIALNGWNPATHCNWGKALLRLGQPEAALPHILEGLRLQTNYPDARVQLGIIRLQQDNPSEALLHLEAGVRLMPDSVEGQFHLGEALAHAGRIDEAITAFREALRRQPEHTAAMTRLAWWLATHPDDKIRNGAEAVRLAERACALTRENDVAALHSLTAAYVEAGRLDLARQSAQQALQLARLQGQDKWVRLGEELWEKIQQRAAGDNK